MMTRDHNEKTEQEQYEDQQFLKGFTELKDITSEMAGMKGDMNAVYKRLKDLGWSKKDYEFAKTLEDKDVGQVIADFERKIRIAKLFGHQLGRQLELNVTDRTPQADRAYEEGLAVGRLRKSTSNPYHPGSEEYQAWQKGMNEGTAFINKELAAEVAPD
ncbi:hypothetical protein G6M23_05525 [Agrobacterium tumefaciens]|nr:hypothetical protein [Agrobacterium tumefaciens]NTD90797.1 hypothetical protein [Agrobacterium tumefaciens]NTD96406.1 hypothetical protein [Agrobacterium tumefaciens]NTE15871.1 hypothetical protein [Agrobacterium tumefaciens]NTE23140.1 hypothetical protein [Agrobacterium tumefaciens]